MKSVLLAVLSHVVPANPRLADAIFDVVGWAIVWVVILGVVTYAVGSSVKWVCKRLDGEDKRFQNEIAAAYATSSSDIAEESMALSRF